MCNQDAYPLLSVITPVYNGFPYLQDLIESVQGQDDGCIEHIVIDDGSTDEGATVEILQKYPHLRWWSRENRGQYATMNEGLREARGKYICFISADDLLAVESIQIIREQLEKTPDIDGIYGRIRYIDENRRPYPVQPMLSRSGRHIYPYFSNIAHCALWVKRSYLLNNELWFDEKLRYIGDYDWINRIFNAQPQLEYVNHLLALLRIHSGQASVSAETAMMSEKKAYYKKFGIRVGMVSLVGFFLSLRSAALRLFSELRVNGWKGFSSLFRYFVLHKLGKV